MKKTAQWPTWGASERRVVEMSILRREAIRRASLPIARTTLCKGGANYHVFTLGAGECSICGAIR